MNSDISRDLGNEIFDDLMKQYHDLGEEYARAVQTPGQGLEAEDLLEKRNLILDKLREIDPTFGKEAA